MDFRLNFFSRFFPDNAFSLEKFIETFVKFQLSNKIIVQKLEFLMVDIGQKMHVCID